MKESFHVSANALGDTTYFLKGCDTLQNLFNAAFSKSDHLRHFPGCYRCLIQNSQASSEVFRLPINRFGQLGLFRRGEYKIRPYYCLMAAIYG